jgi:hypothetical protein
VPSTFEQPVRERAGDRCEYCHVPRPAYDTPFQLDHIIARQHRGATDLANLAYACYHCNLNKGPNIASLDPPGHGQLVRLFNPRTDDWSQHFEWRHAELVGRTPEGRATVLVLNINDPAAVAVRESLLLEGIDFS